MKVIAINMATVNVDNPFQLTLTSGDSGIAAAMAIISADCNVALQADNSLAKISLTLSADRPAMMSTTSLTHAQFLTFNTFARFTLSKHSLPDIASLVKDGTLFLHVFVNSTLAEDKTFNLTVGTVYGYPRGEVYLVAVFSFVIGFLDVLIYLVIFRRRYSFKKFFVRGTLKRDNPAQEEVKEESFLKSLGYVIWNWFRRGVKGYSYLTLMFGLIFFVGAYQVCEDE